MSTALLTDLTIFILALLVGIEVIGKVPATLHTPLMSATNAIHGIVLVGAVLIGVTAHNAVGYVIAFIAAFFAGANVVGGYVVTGRMLKMFRRKSPEAQGQVEGQRRSRAGAGRGERAQGTQGPGEQDEQDRVMSGFNGYIQLVYVLVAAMFVVGLHLMNSPATARRGNQVAQVGMVIAVVATLILLIHAGTVTATGWVVMIVGSLLGSAVGLWAARTVQMTAVPQLVSAFNAVGGGAAALVAIYGYYEAESHVTGVLGTTSVFTVLDVLIGSVTFSGSIIAAGKLQGVIPRPADHLLRRPPGQPGPGRRRRRRGRVHVQHPQPARAAHRGAGLAGVRRADGAADRRRGHAGGHLAAERVHRHRGGDGRVRHRQLGADRGRRAGRARREAS